MEKGSNINKEMKGSNINKEKKGSNIRDERIELTTRMEK